jgi:hypothetical protein
MALIPFVFELSTPSRAGLLLQVLYYQWMFFLTSVAIFGNIHLEFTDET